MDSTVTVSTTPAAFGDFLVTRSTVVFTGGPYATALVEQIQSVQSTLSMRAQLDNVGDTLTISADSKWDVSGGTGRISGGTISSLDGTPLSVTGGAGRLQDVALDADVAVRDGGTLTVQGGYNTVRPLTIRFGGTAAGKFVLETGQTVGGGTQFVFDDRVGHVVSATSGTFSLGPGSTLRTGSGSGTLGTSTAPLQNRGTISAQTAGQSVTVLGNSFDNQGTLQAINGGTLSLVMTANWTNSGTVLVDGGQLNLSGVPRPAAFAPPTIRGASTIGIGSTYTADQVAALNVPGSATIAVLSGGTVDNAGGTIEMSGALPGWKLLGGTISGGTVHTGSKELVAGPIPGGQFGVTPSAGTLSGVTLGGVLRVTGAVLNVQGGLTLDGGSVLIESAAVHRAVGDVRRKPDAGGHG